MEITYIVHQHAFDTILKRYCTRVAGAACASELQIHKAVLAEPAELDIATILLDSRADSRLEELLDHADDLVVVLVVGEAVNFLLDRLGTGGHLLDGDDGLARGDGLGDEGKDLRADVGPVGVAGLCDGDEVGAVEDGGDAVNVHELGGERRGVRRRDGGARVEVLDERRGEALGQHAVVGQELEGVAVGCRLGLDEDGAAGGDRARESRMLGCCLRAHAALLPGQ